MLKRNPRSFQSYSTLPHTLHLPTMRKTSVTLQFLDVCLPQRLNIIRACLFHVSLPSASSMTVTTPTAYSTPVIQGSLTQKWVIVLELHPLYPKELKKKIYLEYMGERAFTSHAILSTPNTLSFHFDTEGDTQVSFRRHFLIDPYSLLTMSHHCASLSN